MKTISKTQRRSAETDEAKAKKEMECDGLHLLWEYLTFKDLNSLVTRNADENSDRSKKENAATLESYKENMLSARNPNLWFETIVYILHLSMQVISWINFVV